MSRHHPMPRPGQHHLSVQRLAQSRVPADEQHADADADAAAAAELAHSSPEHERISVQIEAVFHDVCNDTLRPLVEQFRTELVEAYSPQSLSPSHLDGAAKHVQQYATTAIARLAPACVDAMWATRLACSKRGRLTSTQVFDAFHESFKLYIQDEVILPLLETARRASLGPMSAVTEGSTSAQADGGAKVQDRDKDLRPKTTHPREATELLQIAFGLSAHSTPAEQQVLGNLTGLRRGQVTAWLQNRRHRSNPAAKGEPSPGKQEEQDEDDQLSERVEPSPAPRTESQGAGDPPAATPAPANAGPGAILTALERSHHPPVRDPATPQSRATSPWEPVGSELLTAPQISASPANRDYPCFVPSFAMNQAIKSESDLALDPGAVSASSAPETSQVFAPPFSSHDQHASLQAQHSGSFWMFQDEALSWREPTMYPLASTGADSYLVPPTLPPAYTTGLSSVGISVTSPFAPAPYRLLPSAFVDPAPLPPLPHAGLRHRSRSSLAAAGVGHTADDMMP